MSDLETRESAAAVLQKLGVEVKDGWGLGRIHMEIFEETAEHKLIQPTFITEYPTESHHSRVETMTTPISLIGSSSLSVAANWQTALAS